MAEHGRNIPVSSPVHRHLSLVCHRTRTRPSTRSGWPTTRSAQNEIAIYIHFLEYFSLHGDYIIFYPFFLLSSGRYVEHISLIVEQHNFIRWMEWWSECAVCHQTKVRRLLLPIAAVWDWETAIFFIHTLDGALWTWLPSHSCAFTSLQQQQ